MLNITQSELEGVLTLNYEGELDQHAAAGAIEQSEDFLVLYPCHDLILELSGLTFMDSSGLAVALHLYRTCARMGYGFLIRGAPPQPMRVFEAAGLPQIMKFEGGEHSCAQL